MKTDQERILQRRQGTEVLAGATAGPGAASAAGPARGLGRAAGVLEASDSVAKAIERECQVSRIGIAQVKVRAAKLGENYQKIVEYIDKGREAELELLVFPELCIPGYLALDHFDDELFVEANKEVLGRVVEYTKGSDMVCIVGFVDSKLDPDTGRTRHYNAAAIISDGKILAVVDKTLLPDYDIFWETRYFASAKERSVLKLDDCHLGVEICEDLWDKDYSVKVTDELRAKGADIIANLSCSPFHAGKYRKRADLVRDAAVSHSVPFIYANMVGSQDGYEGEIVFDGRSMIFDPKGRLLAIGKAFEEELIVANLHHSVEIPLPEWNPVEEIHDALVLGIRDYMERCGFKRAYVGISGGIDSAVTAALLAEAIGPENVIGVTMPSRITKSDTLNDAQLLAQNLGIQLKERPIGEMYAAWEKDAEMDHESLSSITRQNPQPRLRMIILHEYTNEDRQSLVVSTGNKTEIALGYCTLYGDMAGGFAPLADISKMVVYDLAHEINRRAGWARIPLSTIERVPTAELEPGKNDRDDLPADYPVLSGLVEKLVSGQDMDSILEEYPADLVSKVSKMIARSEFKRRQASPGIRVTPKAFGSGRRFPIDSNFDPAVFLTNQVRDARK